MSFRYDWYQSDSKVVITILFKNAAEKNYNVIIEKEKVLMTADDYKLELDLFRPIEPSRSAHKATATKIEITLAKESGERWQHLEKKKLNQLSTEATQVATFGSHNWDKIASEIAKSDADEAAGEEALQNLFKKIYSDSNEEVRRAMNKSFLESGGTVLSTNWEDVGDKKVDVKPPDGTEYKRWEC